MPHSSRPLVGAAAKHALAWTAAVFYAEALASSVAGAADSLYLLYFACTPEYKF